MVIACKNCLGIITLYRPDGFPAWRQCKCSIGFVTYESKVLGICKVKYIK